MPTINSSAGFLMSCFPRNELGIGWDSGFWPKESRIFTG